MSTIVSYQCPACRAPLSFDPSDGKFHCEYCMSVYGESELKDQNAIQEEPNPTSADTPSDADADGGEFEEYYCPNCGAEVACEGNTVATFCYYCHTPVIHRGKLTGDLKPSKIVPFQFDKDGAKAAFVKFAKKRWFVPKEFCSEEQIDHIQGIYYPFWIADADATSSLRADATRVRTWSTGKKIYTETSYYDVYRGGEIHFEDITSSALTEADKEMLEGVLPFPSDALIPFSMPYLSGFLTKKRDIASEELEGELQERIQRYGKQLLSDTIKGYATVNVQHSSTEAYRKNWEYALMPLWILVWRDKKGKAFTYAMNGYTGKVWGQLPIHYPKLLGVAGGIGAAIMAVLSILGVIL